MTSTSDTARRAPRPASATASARPIPEPAPVITATLPANRVIALTSVFSQRVVSGTASIRYFRYYPAHAGWCQRGRRADRALARPPPGAPRTVRGRRAACPGEAWPGCGRRADRGRGRGGETPVVPALHGQGGPVRRGPRAGLGDHLAAA